MKKYTALVLLLLASAHIPGDHLFYQWWMGTILISLPIGLFIYKRLGFEATGLFLCSVASSLSIPYFKYGVYQSTTQIVKESLALSSSLTNTCAVFLVLGLLFLGKNRKYIIEAIPLFTVVNALYTIWQFVYGVRYPENWGYTGFIEYSGMNGVLMASCAAFLIPDKKGTWKALGLLLVIIAVLLSNGAVCIGVLVLSILSYSILNNKKWILAIPPIVVAALLVLGAKDFADSGNRFYAYKLFMGDWWRSAFHTFGSGPGTFLVISPYIQKTANFMVNKDGSYWKWAWMHSDWLQMIFEFGFTGIILSVLLFVRAVIKILEKKDARMFSLLTALGGAAVFNYPLRYFSTALLCALVLVEALDKSDN